MTENTATSKSKKKTAFIVIAAIIGILIIVGIVFMIHANSYVNKALKKYDNKILDGVSIENVSVAAMTKKMAADIRAITDNLAEISTSVTAMTKDEQLKKDLTNTLANTNKALSNVTTALASVNKMTPENKTELETLLSDAKVTTCNLKKFSEKLNKRFLIFRLLF